MLLLLTHAQCALECAAFSAMDNNTANTSTLMPPPRYPLRKGNKETKTTNVKRKRGRVKKKAVNRKSLPKGYFLIKQIVNKAIIASRVYYCVVWNLAKGTKRNWIEYTDLVTCLPLMKYFDYEFRNQNALYAHFAIKYIRTISPVEVASQRKALENDEKVMRIVAYEPSTSTIVIFWENSCISALNLKEVTDVGLKMAIGSSLFRENHWAVDYHTAVLTGEKGYSFWDESEEAEDELQNLNENEKKEKEEDGQEEEQFNWDDFYEKLYDNFPNEVVKYWTIVDGRNPVLIFNPSFPAEDNDEDRPENLIAVNHTICTNCGRLFEQPKEALVEHILATGHIGWYAVCLVDKQELVALEARKRRSQRMKNRRRSAVR